MSFKIAFKKSVARDLKRIDKNQTERLLGKIDEELPDKAESFPVLSGKFSGLRKFRVGDYRVIYSIIGDTALILRISHRREAYRK
ncbi:MAG: type II toxin-antitoxin system RelE/ParE family toxin [Deltaproteobacteria bacterium]|nr:type II toxin-antitoxin system RelE/ParE family toxin [Deltaproteobacteria bacterium]